MRRGLVPVEVGLEDEDMLGGEVDGLGGGFWWFGGGGVDGGDSY